MKNKSLIGVYGASGFGRKVIPLVISQYREESEIVFIDDHKLEDEINGKKVLSYQEFLDSSHIIKRAIVAIADANTREMLSLQLVSHGVKLISVFASNVVVLDNNEIRDGAVLCPFVTITSNAKIGLGFQANIYSYVAHDCIIGDYVTFAPGVKCKSYSDFWCTGRKECSVTC